MNVSRSRVQAAVGACDGMNKSLAATRVPIPRLVCEMFGHVFEGQVDMAHFADAELLDALLGGTCARCGKPGEARRR